MATRDVDVYVKLTSGRSVQYDVDSSTQIQKLIWMVSKDEGVAENQVRLKYQGKILTTTKSVREYGIRPETILKSEVLVSKPLAMVLSLPEGNTEEITMSNLESTQSLFEIITDKTGASKNLIGVEYRGQKVKASTLKLMDVGIENCAELKVTIRDEKEEVKKKTSSTAPIKSEAMAEDEKEALMSTFQCDGRQVEVVFSFDTTGSMYTYLEQVRSKLRECCVRLIQDIPNIRIGLVAHGDYCDQDVYVLRSVDLTNDIDMLVNFAKDVPSTCGGDCPECYEWVLRKAQHLDWSEDSAKALVVIGDYYPHPPSYTDQDIKWRDELDVLKGMGVKLYGVQAGTIGDASHFYAEMAERTEGSHLKLTHFDVITDMFLAVCYREGNEEMLEDFQQELQGAGRMSEQTKAMFDELKETKEEKKKKEQNSGKSKPKRYVKDEWWDHSLASRVQLPSYVYDQQTDTWKFNSEPVSRSPPSATTTPSRGISSSLRRSFRKKKRCSLM